MLGQAVIPGVWRPSARAAGALAGFLTGMFAVGDARVATVAASDLVGLAALALLASRKCWKAHAAVAAFGGSALAKALQHEAWLGGAGAETSLKLAVCVGAAGLWRRGGLWRSGHLAELAPAGACSLLWAALGFASAPGLGSPAFESIRATVRVFAVALFVLGGARVLAAIWRQIEARLSAAMVRE